MTAPASPAELIDGAVADRTVPGAVLAAGVRSPEPLLLHVAGDARHDAAGRRPMTAGTVFDLASLTKVVATMPCVLHLAGRGEIGLDEQVRRYLPAFAGPGKETVTVRQLLTHSSGLPGQRRYYQQLPGPAQILAAALAEPLAAAPGTAVCYSDVGFIILGQLAADVAGCGLDELAQRVICEPLGMTQTRYRPPREWAGRIAATEAVRGTAKVGVVHDENAEALGGLAGQAGLFGTAADLGRYAAAWTRRDQLAAVLPLPPRLRSEALRCHTDGLNGRRGLGWGLRGDRWDNMGDGWPESGAGHTGFTGTSLSLDSRSGLWAVLLTNAVHFGRGPEHSVVGLRKHVHAAVAAALGPVAENRDRD